MTLRTEIPLQKRKVYKKGITHTLGLLIPGVFVFGILMFIIATADDPPDIAKTLLGLAIIGIPSFFLLLIVWNFVYEYYYWKRYFYDMDEKNIIIRKGVLAQKEITLPFSRITDVYVDQDLFDVMFGLYDVHISTPTAESGQFAHIDGVDKQGSQRLREMLLERINRTS